MDSFISTKTGIPLKSVSAVIKLLEEGATIPFIARYRKEATGALDEVEIEKIESERNRFLELAKRKEQVLNRLQELGIADVNLLSRIRNCTDSVELEDLYLPYKQKRKTRATAARELGLEPLAKIIMAQRQNDIIAQAHRFARKGLSADDALQGARDIIAEWVSESVAARNQVRRIYQNSAVIKSRVDSKKEEEAQNYKDYFEFDQPLKRLPGHRILAILRAEKEGLLKVKIEIDQDFALEKLDKIFIRSNAEAANQISIAVKDGLKRLLMPGIETEIRQEAKEKADEEAIGIFANNLRQLLLAPPLGSKRVLALDPGYKSGCKLVCLDETGALLHHSTIFPHPPQSKIPESKQSVLSLISKYKMDVVAVGNGTAGRETEQFIRQCLPKNSPVQVFMVNESGASIYSASETGRKEFPDLDLTVRGAVSIGRRLLDPLAELVKIDPKSIGVGQYQHDVAQDKLRNSLGNTVISAVNKVGANVNTASAHLLQYISGVGPKLAEQIVDHRNTHGKFLNRKQLMKVKGFGAKSFEQAAGFLRIPDGDNPLDSSAVHPESYDVVGRMATRYNTKISNLIGNESITKSINLNDFVNEKTGLPTLQDIISELNKPGLDPRGVAESLEFDETIRTIDDLKVGMILPGRITNLTKFGAFTDIGIKENGMIHISQITDRAISDPADFLHIDQLVKVRVRDIDHERKRIGLSLKDIPA
ncbi:MAG: S1 RNA-binding domain-containing protein [Bacteroidetes bacterium]|nr:S1 RNA-binding domain-containing protein [Bacteroidota bacterium]